MPRFLRLLLWASFLAIIAGSAGFAMLPVIRERQSLAAERDVLKAENDALQLQIDELHRSQSSFRANEEYVELVARREGMVRPSETVYDFSGEAR